MEEALNDKDFREQASPSPLCGCPTIGIDGLGLIVPIYGLGFFLEGLIALSFCTFSTAWTPKMQPTVVVT